jgi:hypothetical protein
VILSAVVMISAAMLGSMFLRHPNQPASPAVVSVYSVSVVGPQYYGTTAVSASQQCGQIAQALYSEGLVSKKTPLEIGNSTSKYAYVVVFGVLQPGVINGVKITAFAGGQLYKIVQKNLNLPVGRYVLCIYTDKYYFDAKIEFLGANTICVDCVAR